MLELAEDEQQIFIENSKRKALNGLKPSGKPTFTLVLGAQGSGKSSLTERFENAAVISPDAYVADYYAAVGIDPRDNPYDHEIGDFASLAENAVKNAFSGMEDALANFVTTGKINFSDFADAVVSDLSRIAIRQAITQPLMV